MKRRTKYLIFSLLFASGLLFSCLKENSLQLNPNYLNRKKMPIKLNVIGLSAFLDPSTILTVDQIDKAGAVSNFNINYGYLYNPKAIKDARNIAPVGYRVATKADWIALRTFVGGQAVAGSKLKEAGTDHWNAGNTGTNEFQMNLRGIGYYSPTISNFNSLKVGGNYMTTTETTAGNMDCINVVVNTNSLDISTVPVNSNYGQGFRCIKEDGILPIDNLMTLNNGKKIKVVKIGDQVWQAEETIETKFRNGDDIEFHTVADNFKATANPAFIAYGTISSNSLTNYFPDKMIIEKIEAVTKTKATNETTTINLNPYISNLTLGTPSTQTGVNIGQEVTIPTGIFTIKTVLNTPINQIIDPYTHSGVTIQVIYSIKDTNANSITNFVNIPITTQNNLNFTDPAPEVYCPVNGYMPNTAEAIETAARENGFIKLEDVDTATYCTSNGYLIPKANSNNLFIDTMHIEDFKQVAATRLGTEPNKVKTKLNVLNFKTVEEDNKVIKLLELENKRSCSYVKNLQFTTASDVTAISCLDKLENAEITVFKGNIDKTQGTNFFADQLNVVGEAEGQVIYFTAEKLI